MLQLCWRISRIFSAGYSFSWQLTVLVACVVCGDNACCRSGFSSSRNPFGNGMVGNPVRSAVNHGPLLVAGCDFERSAAARRLA